jgi:phage tail sheath protein FI
VAGIFARSDARVGVFKAPANEELIGVLDLEFLVDAATQERLNPEGINCLRAFPGRGLRVWGARTLSLDANWFYINVRRLVLTLVRWINRNMGWAAFEANTPRLWNRIQRELNVYLGQLWDVGALKGASAAEAFYVKCDSETNPADEREEGRVVTEIRLAPSSPAEFVVVRIIHRPGAAQLG